MKRFAAAVFASLLSFAAAAQEGPANPGVNDRLLIVNGNSGRVIYDDGRNDLFCVTRRFVVGYNQWGHRVYRRNMRCR